MHVLIACPGPSLTAHLAQLSSPATPSEHVAGVFNRSHVMLPGIDLTLAVNRAVEAFPADIFVFGDAPAFDRFTPHPDSFPILSPGPSALSDLRPLFAGRQLLPWDDFNPSPPTRAWHTYSDCAAVVLAVGMGATAITIAGQDLAGENDFTGVPAADRDEFRWAFNRHFLAGVVRWAHRRPNPPRIRRLKPSHTLTSAT